MLHFACSERAMQHAHIDQNKLKAVLAYIAEKNRPGKVKLFKLLYLIDFESYVLLGKSLTGETYERFPMGPVPRTLWHDFEQITCACVELQTQTSGMPLP